MGNPYFNFLDTNGISVLPGHTVSYGWSGDAFDQDSDTQSTNNISLDGLTLIHSYNTTLGQSPDTTRGMVSGERNMAFVNNLHGAYSSYNNQHIQDNNKPQNAISDDISLIHQQALQELLVLHGATRPYLSNTIPLCVGPWSLHSNVDHQFDISTITSGSNVDQSQIQSTAPTEGFPEESSYDYDKFTQSPPQNSVVLSESDKHISHAGIGGVFPGPDATNCPKKLSESDLSDPEGGSESAIVSPVNFAVNSGHIILNLAPSRKRGLPQPSEGQSNKRQKATQHISTTSDNGKENINEAIRHGPLSESAKEKSNKRKKEKTTCGNCHRDGILCTYEDDKIEDDKIEDDKIKNGKIKKRQNKPLNLCNVCSQKKLKKCDYEGCCSNCHIKRITCLKIYPHDMFVTDLFLNPAFIYYQSHYIPLMHTVKPDIIEKFESQGWELFFGLGPRSIQVTLQGFLKIANKNKQYTDKDGNISLSKLEKKYEPYFSLAEGRQPEQASQEEVCSRLCAILDITMAEPNVLGPDGNVLVLDSSEDNRLALQNALSMTIHMLHSDWDYWIQLFFKHVKDRNKDLKKFHNPKDRDKPLVSDAWLPCEQMLLCSIRLRAWREAVQRVDVIYSQFFVLAKKLWCLEASRREMAMKNLSQRDKKVAVSNKFKDKFPLWFTLEIIDFPP